MDCFVPAVGRRPHRTGGVLAGIPSGMGSPRADHSEAILLRGSWSRRCSSTEGVHSRSPPFATMGDLVHAIEGRDLHLSFRIDTLLAKCWQVYSGQMKLDSLSLD